ncbi:hypothetical protein RHMOL_Rhmol04G0055200 [Rhododendron molle]|uniref:Uncharacterized protein n=1 Tax=Rhododendron molle TaxID=49168 RepID=A0ACC0NX89_RHOML|nr:hypothetical protein RHMOL_Rhmol04G0055200 [Rhododendron molle]
MDALWNLEDKWKITTQKAVFAFTCTAFLVCGICIAAAIRRRARQRQLVSQEPSEEYHAEATKRLEPQLLRLGSCGSIKRVLTGSVRWSNARKWGERGSSRSRRERAAPLLVGRGREREVGCQSHNSMAPVWQRPILMGEKCELPRFSGLILYDERGRSVHSSGIGTTDHHQQNAELSERHRHGTPVYKQGLALTTVPLYISKNQFLDFCKPSLECAELSSWTELRSWKDNYGPIRLGWVGTVSWLSLVSLAQALRRLRKAVNHTKQVKTCGGWPQDASLVNR